MAEKQPLPPNSAPPPLGAGYPQGPPPMYASAPPAPPGYQPAPPGYQPPPPGYQPPPPGYQMAPGPPPPYHSGATGHSTVILQQGTTKTVIQPKSAGHTTVILQQGATRTVVQPKPSRGLFGSIIKEVDLIAKQAGRELDYCSGKINQTVDQHSSHQVLTYFQTGNMIQLISRTTNRTLEIVAAPTGHLLLDGCGPMDQQPHTLWTVVNEGSNQVRLHNNNNYLTIVNGNTSLITMPPGAVHGVETKFQLGMVGITQYLVLQSLKESRCHVGVLPTGQLKKASSTGREEHAQFGVRLVYTPYGQQVTTVTTVKK